MMITGKHLRQSLFLVADQVCNFIKKETLAQVFSCEFSEIFKNTSGACFWSSITDVREFFKDASEGDR